MSQWAEKQFLLVAMYCIYHFGFSCYVRRRDEYFDDDTLFMIITATVGILVILIIIIRSYSEIFSALSSLKIYIIFDIHHIFCM